MFRERQDLQDLRRDLTRAQNFLQEMSYTIDRLERRRFSRSRSRSPPPLRRSKDSRRDDKNMVADNQRQRKKPNNTNARQPDWGDTTVHIQNRNGADMSEVQKTFQKEYGDALCDFFVHPEQKWANAKFRDKAQQASCLEDADWWKDTFQIDLSLFVLYSKWI